MSYRRDITEDEHILVPIETVYNSDIDSRRVPRKFMKQSTKFFHNGEDNFNRIYFHYPAEWKTSNIGEKIIGIRNMTIHWKDGSLRFILYIRKYRQTLLPKSRYDDEANQNKINEIDDDELEDNMKIIGIPINIRVDCNDTWNDIKERIMNVIDQENLYNYIYHRLNLLYSVPSTIIPKLEQLESIKYNYHAMLQASFDLIGERIPFYLEPNDVYIIKTIDKAHSYLNFVSPQNNKEKKQFFIDFMITDVDVFSDDIHTTYEKIYQSTQDGVLLGKTRDNPEGLDIGDFFNDYTAHLLNIGISKYKNDLKYIIRFHRQLNLKDIMTSLDCEVVASFASQSHHNIIGRTNETFIPIKYYKLLDNDNTFWIEFYDRDNFKIPVSFNDNVVFTMDMAFLQNRKLLYS